VPRSSWASRTAWWKAGDAKPAKPAGPAAPAAASCSVFISDASQMWRSSWSGPRGYNNWHGTGLTSNSFIDYGWSTDCNDGGGTYTYYLVMQGYASGIGWGPKPRSNNDLRKGCGTRSPNP
jgi:hypothetical protein